MWSVPSEDVSINESAEQEHSAAEKEAMEPRNIVELEFTNAKIPLDTKNLPVVFSSDDDSDSLRFVLPENSEFVNLKGLYAVRCSEGFKKSKEGRCVRSSALEF